MLALISTYGQDLVDALTDNVADLLLIGTAVVGVALVPFGIKFAVPWGLGLFKTVAKK